MRYRAVILTTIMTLILAIGVIAQPVHAQQSSEPTMFKNVTLWIYPEYDDPRLLVMLQGQITGVNPPVQVKFLVPAAAEMYSAGSMDAQNNYSGGPPDRKPSQIAGWDEISYELKTNTFRVEYYDPVITGEPEKKIAYDFRYLYPISDLKVMVQEPKTSTDYRLSPEGTLGTEGGFRVHNFSYSDLTADNTLHFDLAYTKTDPNPSISGQEDTPGTGSASKWILITTAIIVLAGLGMYIIKSRKKSSNAKKNRVKTRQAVIADNGPRKTRFCNQCGSPVEKSSNFCSKCGYKLKSSK